ncbi:MAG: hypothetical protein LBQ68_08010 [Clostridiales bacterium]|jgi:uncharacterized protein YjgD (DUF1641 family)|nr:hypothetical protein [Clostridiales bacterium]
MKEIQELLFGLLQAFILATIPVITSFVIQYLKNKTEQTITQIQNEKARLYLEELTGTVSAAVAQTSQTYVDELKKNGTFDKEAQKIALEKAKQTAFNTLTPAAKSFISEAYSNMKNDLNTAIEARVEEAVRIQNGV